MALLLEALAPGFLVLGFAWAVLPWLKAEDERARAAMVAVMLVLMWRYMAWRWIVTLPPIGLGIDFVIGLVFVTIETLVVIGATISADGTHAATSSASSGSRACGAPGASISRAAADTASATASGAWPRNAAPNPST